MEKFSKIYLNQKYIFYWRCIINKKILAIFALLIVATSISAVSAFDLGSIFGGDQNETVTIDELISTFQQVLS